jgi:hypothetical protein
VGGKSARDDANFCDSLIAECSLLRILEYKGNPMLIGCFRRFLPLYLGAFFIGQFFSNKKVELSPNTFISQLTLAR